MVSLLEVDDVTVVFGGNKALDSAGLRAERGQVTGLIGPNGAGKSTLFDVIGGLRKPTTGRVSIGGVDVTKHGPAKRAKHGLARTFQRLELFDASVSATTCWSPPNSVPSAGARAAPSTRSSNGSTCTTSRIRPRTSCRPAPVGWSRSDARSRRARA